MYVISRLNLIKKRILNNKFKFLLLRSGCYMGQYVNIYNY